MTCWLKPVCDVQEGLQAAMQWLQGALYIAAVVAAVLAFLFVLVLLRNAFGERGVWAGLVGGALALGTILGRRWATKPAMQVVTTIQTRDQVKELQVALTARGLYDDEIDGKYGLKTHAGVNAVERSLRLRVTPFDEHNIKINPKVLTALGL